MRTIIKDIRYFEFNRVPGIGSYSARAGTLFALPERIGLLGERIALKLRELEVSIGASHHLCVALTRDLGEDDVVLAGRQTSEPWMQYVAVGLPNDFNTRSVQERHALIEARTFAAVRVLAPEAHEAIETCKDALALFGSALRIRRLVHTTRRYHLEVQYTVAPPVEAQAWLIVHDQETGERGERAICTLESFDDVFALITRATIRDGVVTLHPRKSSRAEFSTRRYRTPITIPLAEVLGAGAA